MRFESGQRPRRRGRHRLQASWCASATSPPSTVGASRRTSVRDAQGAPACRRRAVEHLAAPVTAVPVRGRDPRAARSPRGVVIDLRGNPGGFTAVHRAWQDISSPTPWVSAPCRADATISIWWRSRAVTRDGLVRTRSRAARRSSSTRAELEPPRSSPPACATTIARGFLVCPRPRLRCPHSWTGCRTATCSCMPQWTTSRPNGVRVEGAPISSRRGNAVAAIQPQGGPRRGARSRARLDRRRAGFEERSGSAATE